MLTNLPALKEGDLIYITAPAKAIEADFINYAKQLLEHNKFRVEISPDCFGHNNYFSGTIEERLQDLQIGFNHPEAKAILCARGGYGCVQLLDELNWDGFCRSPKWLIGFSDVTFLHQKINSLGLKSIHGTMPLNFKENSQESFTSLFSALKKEPYKIASISNRYNIIGSTKGKVLGGNLSIIYASLGTNYQPNYESSILFIEDLFEPLYHIDRMFYALKHNGVLDKINGLIIGGMTNLGDSTPPFGKNINDIISSHVQHLNIPVAFDFPAGHIDNNQAITLGANADFIVSNKGGELCFGYL